MSVTTIAPGQQIEIDPSDKKVITFNWDDHLTAGATIATSTFTITAIRPASATGLTKDNETILSSGSYGNRYTQLRLLAGGDSTVGQKFEVANKVVTTETPTQTIERSFQVLIQQK